MPTGIGRSIPLRAVELENEGPEGAQPLPSPEEAAALEGTERHELLERLRVELYAIAASLADATVRRARRDASSYPPYGLVRSMHTESRMVLASPEPVTEGSVSDFRSLGKAYMDTMVFHLDRQFHEQRSSERAWMLLRLEALLALFRIDAGPASRSRMRDGLSFLYGGLHFGTSVCVQLVEVMSRLLSNQPSEMTVQKKVDVLQRSSRPALRLATLNIDHVILAYQRLQAPPGGGQDGWMDQALFTFRPSKDGRIDLRDEETLDGRPGARRFDDIATTYATHGCPARVSPGGGRSAIATLWSWGVELARDTGLLTAHDAASR